MIKRVLSFCNRYQLISPNDLIFVALSGGLDSVVLLDVFLALRERIPLRIEVVHVNHGIRGAEADRDEFFVRSLCRERGVSLHVLHLQGFDAHSSEEALREARYEMFDTLLRPFPKAKIATAHTLDDNIETFFMRLAKGSSLKGLRGIPVKRGAYIRPLLFLKRAELEQYAHTRKLAFVEDSTNASLKYLRNRIRHQLLPVFTEIFGDRFYDGLAKSLEEIGAFHDLFEAEFMRIFQDIALESGSEIEIDLEKYKVLNRLYRYRLIDYCISVYYPLNYSFPRRYLQEIDRFVQESHSGAVLNVYKDIRLVKDREKIAFVKEKPLSADTVFLEAETKVQIGAFEIEIRKVRPGDVRFTNDNTVEYICGDALHFPLSIRHWQAGDRFYPLGMGKSQKLKEFFINQKIDVLTKSTIPLVCDGENIIWVAGYRLDERYRVQENCKTIYRLTIKKR